MMLNRWSSPILYLTTATCLILLVVPANSQDRARPHGVATTYHTPSQVELPRARPEIIRYARTEYALYFIAVGWRIAGLTLVFPLGWSRRLRDRVERRIVRALPRAAWFYAAFSLLLLAWNLPIHLASYLIERAYGFSTETPTLWLADLGRAYLFGLLYIPAVWIGYLALERSPRRWWLWLWVGSIPWTLAITVLYPVFIAPAYNRFEPLPDSPLRRRLLELAERAGIQSAAVYRVDISKRTRKLNAYVSGLGPTKRLVLWDTTLRTLTDDEIVAIMGHEIGHDKLNHVWWGFVAGVGEGFALLWLLSKLLPWAVARFGRRGGVRNLHDLAGLPLALILINLLIFFQMPAESAFSRWEERAADRYGLELTHLNEATARAFIRFVEANYDDPDPPSFIVFWFYSHPPLRERVEFALAFRG